MTGTPVQATPIVKRDSGAANLVSGSFATAVNDLIICDVLMGGSGSKVPTSITSSHGTFSKVGVTLQMGTRFSHSKYVCPVLVGTTAAITIVAASSACGVTFTKVSDVNTITPTTNVKEAKGYGTAATFTFDATPTNTTVQGWCSDGATITTEHTELDTLGFSFGGKRISSSYDTSLDDTPTATIGSPKDWSVIGIELLDAAPAVFNPSTSELTVVVGGAGVVPQVNGILDGDTVDSGGVLSYTIITQPSNGTIDVNHASGYLEYSPNTGYVGTDIFTYELFESGVSAGLQTIYVVVAGGVPANTPPVVTPPSTLEIEFTFGDAGLDKSDAGLVAWLASATVADDTDTLTASGDVSGLPNPIPAGTTEITFTSQVDSGGESGSDTATLTVSEAEGVTPGTDPILARDATDVPRYKGIGLPEDTGSMSVDSVNDVASVVAGIAFTASGRICVSVEGVIVLVENGLPKDADGKLCVSTDPTTQLSGAVPLTASSRIAIAWIDPTLVI